MNGNALPHYTGPMDPLRTGFRSLETEMNVQHPVKIMQTAQKNSQWISKLDIVRKTYGSHMAMRLETERQLLDHSHRLPGLESSKISLQTVMGTDETIDFSDYLNGRPSFIDHLITNLRANFFLFSLIFHPSDGYSILLVRCFMISF